MRLISEAETRSALDIPTAADVITRTYRQFGEARVHSSRPSALAVAQSPHRIQVKGAVLEARDIAGARLSSRPFPRIVLWRLSTGEPIAWIDESWLYRFRTGVSAAVVAQWLLPQDRPSRIAVIGAGPIAWEMMKALSALIAPAELKVAARRASSARAFAERARESGVAVSASPDVASAVADVDLVVTITSAREPFLKPGMIREETAILSMGGRPEVDLGLWNQATARFVDDFDYACGRGDAAAWIGEGSIDRHQFERSLTGTVGDLACGRWRNTAGAMAIVQGMAVLDVALAHEVFLKCSSDVARSDSE